MNDFFAYLTLNIPLLLQSYRIFIMLLVRAAIATWSYNGFFSYLKLGLVSLDRCEARSILLVRSKLGTEGAMHHEIALQQARSTG